MQVGTEILLARMKEYPEEFLGIHKGMKWDRVLMDARSCLPSDEIAALDEMLKQLNIDRFNEDVLRTLAGEEQPENLKYKASERYDNSWTDPRAMHQVGQGRQRMMGGAFDPNIQVSRATGMTMEAIEEKRQMMQNSAAQMGQNAAAQNTASGMPSGLMGSSGFLSGIFK